MHVRFYKALWFLVCIAFVVPTVNQSAVLLVNVTTLKGRSVMLLGAKKMTTSKVNAALGPLEDLRSELERLGLEISGKVTRRSFDLRVEIPADKGIEEETLEKTGGQRLRTPLTGLVWLSLFTAIGFFLWNKFIGGPNPGLVIMPILWVILGVGCVAKWWLDQDFKEHLESPLTRAEAVTHRGPGRLLEILMALWTIRTAPIGARFRNPFLPRRTYENDSHLFMADPLVRAVKQVCRSSGRSLLDAQELDQKAAEVAKHLSAYQAMYQRTVRPAAFLVSGFAWMMFTGIALFLFVALF